MNHRVNVPTIHNDCGGDDRDWNAAGGGALSRPEYREMTEHVPPFLDRNRDAQKRCAFAMRMDRSIL